MSIEVKPGRWQMRNGETAVVVDCDGIFSWPWRGRIERDTQLTSWSRGGRWGPVPGPFDLVEYFGVEGSEGGEL